MLRQEFMLQKCDGPHPEFLQRVFPKGVRFMTNESNSVTELTADRRAGNRRRSGERRQGGTVVEGMVERRESSRRNKVERRRQIDPTTCERDYTDQEIEFMKAMDEYKRRSGRQFPTWSEVLEVIRNLGYRQVAEQTELYTPK